MVTIQKLSNEIWTLRQTEFPDQPQQAASLPSADVDMTASVGVCTLAHVKASSRIETQEDYQAKLATYQEQCRQAQ